MKAYSNNKAIKAGETYQIEEEPHQVQNDRDDGYFRHRESKRNQNVFLYALLLLFGSCLGTYWTIYNLQLEMKVTIKKSDIWKYQVANTVSFITCLVVALTAPKW